MRLFFLIRNFLLTLLPVVFANHGHRQIHAFVIILLFTGFPQAMLQPYRGLAPNVLEALVASCLTMLLLGAGFLLGAENREVVTNDLQIFFGIFIALGCLGFSITVCRQVFLRFFPDPRYFAFLSHHKGGCSVGARVMKIELERKLGKKCFLDSDNLDSLEVLLDIVRTSTNHVVLLLTSETLWRPWCAGEIAVAKKNHVPLVCVAYDDYTEPADSHLTTDSLSQRWTNSSFAAVALQGVTVEDVQHSYRVIRLMPKIQLRRVASFHNSLSDFEDVSVQAVTRVINVCLKRSVTSITSEGTTSKSMTSRAFDGVVVANCMDGEALSRAWLLVMMLQRNLPLTFGQLHHMRDVRGMSIQTLRYIVISLTATSLWSKEFVRTLLEVRRLCGKVKILVVKSSDFQFPSLDVLQESLCPQMAMMLSVGTNEVSELLDYLLSFLVMPFTPEAHVTVLEAEVRRFSVRLGDTTEQFRRFATDESKGSGTSTKDNNKEADSCAPTEPTLCLMPEDFDEQSASSWETATDV